MDWSSKFSEKSFALFFLCCKDYILTAISLRHTAGPVYLSSIVCYLADTQVCPYNKKSNICMDPGSADVAAATLIHKDVVLIILFPACCRTCVLLGLKKYQESSLPVSGLFTPYQAHVA